MTDPREAVQSPADPGRCSNLTTHQPKETPYDWAYLLSCSKCGANGGEGWALVSQQSHCNRILEPNERLLQKGGWSYVYVHNCGAGSRAAGEPSRLTTEEVEQFWTGGADALRPSTLNDQLRASIAQFPPALRRMVDDEPPAEIFDPTLQQPIVDLEITPAGVAALSELAAQSQPVYGREQLLASLICASRNLAQDRVRMRHTIDRGSVYYCGECQADIESDPLRQPHEHLRSCNTGLVFLLLSELAKVGGAA
jgi:hypothetical protein